MHDFRVGRARKERRGWIFRIVRSRRISGRRRRRVVQLSAIGRMASLHRRAALVSGSDDPKTVLVGGGGVSHRCVGGVEAMAAVLLAGAIGWMALALVVIVREVFILRCYLCALKRTSVTAR